MPISSRDLRPLQAIKICQRQHLHREREEQQQRRLQRQAQQSQLPQQQQRQQQTQQQQLEEIPPEEIPAENIAPCLYVATDLFAAECVQRLGLHPRSREWIETYIRLRRIVEERDELYEGGQRSRRTEGRWRQITELALQQHRNQQRRRRQVLWCLCD